MVDTDNYAEVIQHLGEHGGRFRCRMITNRAENDQGKSADSTVFTSPKQKASTQHRIGNNAEPEFVRDQCQLVNSQKHGTHGGGRIFVTKEETPN